ncbi:MULTISPECIES: OmpA family protein [Candidatus Ichthyocystis]|uniref:OmpA family protein n=1 Tax=Candidatus Ichthyocystis TaxID=2929841 RepID=UPI000B2A73AC|nr:MULTISPECIES: OmpA family protein [Ichthyocystis]
MKKVGGLFLVFLLAGCATSVYDNKADSYGSNNMRNRSSDVNSDNYAPIQSIPLDSKSVSTSESNFDSGGEELSGRNIYFAFDSFTVDPKYQKVVLDAVAHLRDNPEDSVRIIGNTDERGSRGYNLALGQKRAEVVRQAFISMGVESSRVEAVSFGKEKPKAMGHDDASWAVNRRSDLLYKSLGEF